MMVRIITDVQETLKYVFHATKNTEYVMVAHYVIDNCLTPSGINLYNMTEIELYNELQYAEVCLNILDSQISELRKKKNDIMNDFLSLLPFQKGDKVKDKDGNIFIIEHLKEAISLGKNEIEVRFLIRRIKKNGEPYQCPNEAWGIDYFSLEKVVE